MADGSGTSGTPRDAITAICQVFGDGSWKLLRTLCRPCNCKEQVCGCVCKWMWEPSIGSLFLSLYPRLPILFILLSSLSCSQFLFLSLLLILLYPSVAKLLIPGLGHYTRFVSSSFENQHDFEFSLKDISPPFSLESSEYLRPPVSRSITHTS